ncbi:unnamed protein product [Onchocerca ochengi]|uniref:Bestrophin homolog n=1 Tax=Onchocerca ochengi TaxID=42157 RepID=A0A182EAI4_ONCOC|nr:unnamed protein product [Onchocerca ochengi]
MTKDLIDVEVPFVPVINHKSSRNEVSDKTKGTSINEECGTFNAKFAPCVQKEIADQIFHDCCKLYVEPECHELCQYETNRDVAQLLVALLEIFREKKCPVDNISAVLYCASQNRDNRLCCRKFGLISLKLDISRRCLRMCDPHRFDITVLREYDFVCLNNWDIIMYCHHGGLSVKMSSNFTLFDFEEELDAETCFHWWIIWCEIGSQYIPLSFLLGFFVAVVVARWWEQFNYISWPDKLMMMVATCLPGDHNLPVRQAIARWSSLQAAIAWSGISVRTLKRFPTERHLVEADLMTEEEYKMFTETEARHGKWFIPVMWISNLLGALYRQKRIDSMQLNMLMQQLYSFRDGFAMLFVYDWVKIPLVYTQVVAIATYGYFLICLIGRQPKIDEHSMKKEVSILFPVFTTLQILFYIGWLKVGQYLMNPFGEDDDDFELNYVLDRNTFIAHMMATNLANQLPTISRNGMRVLLPHTKASFKIQDVIPKNHLMDFKLTEDEMKLIQLDEFIGNNENNEKRTEQKLGLLTRSIGPNKKTRSRYTQEKATFI